jgi:hypothetical protein
MPAVLEGLRDAWDKRIAIMVADGGMPRVKAECLAWERLHHSAEPQ